MREPGDGNLDLEQFWRAIPDKEALKDLTRDQSQAIFRLLMLAAFADSEVTVTERLGLAQAVTRLPFFNPDDWRIFDHADGVQILGNLNDRYADPTERAELLKEIRAQLGDESGRVLALRMVALFVQPDGYDSDEHAFCQMIGQAFGLDADEINVVIEDVLSSADDGTQAY